MKLCKLLVLAQILATRGSLLTVHKGKMACCEPCVCPPVTFPYAEVIMTCPPPCLAPTRPEPVKPLQLPCPPCIGPPCPTPVEAVKCRYDNYYNNYNIDWHCENRCLTPCPPPPKKCCEDYVRRKPTCPDTGCPTGFKPCKMRMTPPCCGGPYGIWIAQVQHCPPKGKKINSAWYVPGPCCKPFCKHWRPKEPPCCYDNPCRAHCYDHPPGIKPSGRYP